MMQSSEVTTLFGDFKIYTTDNRGFTPEELADMALEKIIFVGKDANPLLKDQAIAFKENIRGVLIHYLNQAIQSDRTTVANKLRDAGHPELIKLLND
jgi:hypothetical protein